MNLSEHERPVVGWRECVISNDLPPTTRHVLLTLSLHMDIWGRSCYPTTKQLAYETGLSERSVITHLAVAEKLGWLGKSEHGFGDQRWKNHEYQPRVPDGVKPNPWVGSRRKGTEPPSSDSPEGTEPLSKGTEPLSKGTEPDDTKALKEVQCSSSFSSSTVEEKVVRPRSPAGDLPAELAEAYRRHLPWGVQFQAWSAKRRQALRRLQREHPFCALPGFWDAFFSAAARDKFVRGEVPAKPGQDPFRVHIDYLLREDVFVGIYERQLDAEERAVR